MPTKAGKPDQSDQGTPDDPSDDIIFRGGQREREAAIRVFNKFTKNIELNLSPRSDIEFLSDTIAMVEYDYKIKLSQPPSPEAKFETFYASGNMTIILERRESPEGMDSPTASAAKYPLPIFQKVIEEIKRDNITPQELRIIKDEAAWERTLRESFEEGHGKGSQEGRRREKEQIALSMLQKGMDIALISEMTGLKPEELESLKSAEPMTG